MSTEPQATPQTIAKDPRMDEKGTSYVILKRAENGWFQADTVYGAASADAAIRKAIAAENETNGEYVAIPTRSWRPQKVTVETTKTVRLG